VYFIQHELRSSHLDWQGADPCDRVVVMGEFPVTWHIEAAIKRFSDKVNLQWAPEQVDVFSGSG